MIILLQLLTKKKEFFSWRLLPCFQCGPFISGSLPPPKVGRGKATKSSRGGIAKKNQMQTAKRVSKVDKLMEGIKEGLYGMSVDGEPNKSKGEANCIVMHLLQLIAIVTHLLQLITIVLCFSIHTQNHDSIIQLYIHKKKRHVKFFN